MKKKISVATCLVLVLFAVLLTFQITYNVIENEYQKTVDTLTKTQSDFSLLAYADDLIRENFNGAVEEDALEVGLIKGYVSSLSDRYSRYLTAEEYRNYKEEQKSTGTGIGARFTYNAETKEVIVCAVFDSSPAFAAGLRKGDVLDKIDSKPVSDLGFQKAVQALSGEKGTEVTVTVKRRLAAQILDMDFTMTRQELSEPSVSFEMLSESVAYIQIFDMGEKTVEEFSAAVDQAIANGAKGVVFDVRNNVGSEVNATCVDAACKMLDRLLPQGVLMKKTDNKGKETVVKSDENAVTLQMAVLMNSATTCAPELFAATLRDFGAAVLVGETTYGKGTLQTLVELENGSALILSNATFTPPSSPGFEGVGVIPDVESKTKTENLYLTDRDDDTALQDAVKALGF